MLFSRLLWEIPTGSLTIVVKIFFNGNSQAAVRDSRVCGKNAGEPELNAVYCHGKVSV